MSHGPIVELKQLGKKYKGKKKGERISALKDLSLTVMPGEIVGLLGPNGAGKTTAVKMMMGYIIPDTGTIHFHGALQQFAEPRPNTGYLPESFKPNPNLTVLEYVQFLCTLSGTPASKISSEAMALLTHVGMEQAKDKRISELSKGMGQRVGIAQAFAGDPDLLILDEPTSGLDPVGRSEIMGFLTTQKKAGKTIFFCSHILSEVEMICDRVGILVQGELTVMDTLENLKQKRGSESLEEVFMQEVTSCK